MWEMLPKGDAPMVRRRGLAVTSLATTTQSIPPAGFVKRFHLRVRTESMYDARASICGGHLPTPLVAATRSGLQPSFTYPADLRPRRIRRDALRNRSSEMRHDLFSSSVHRCRSSAR